MAKESREDLIKRWAQDTGLNQMSEQQLFEKVEKAAADEGYELQTAGDAEVIVFKELDDPEGVLPEGVLVISISKIADGYRVVALIMQTGPVQFGPESRLPINSVDTSLLREALVEFLAMLELERLGGPKPES